ncbi:hypothetical protein [Pectobacterium polaris]|uniref:hypothetical protein n=1 Tax=Pectobacterium polaris TaxID=2042057 RepID=UPI002B24D105|nr:hypothetical protein [Pectobacterium polaris]
MAYFSRSFSSHSSDNDTEEEKIIKIANIYKEKNIYIKISSTLLQDKTLIDCIINGSFKPIEIQRDLNQHQYFIEPKSIKPWMALMEFDTLDDETTEHIISKLDASFKNREITNLGDIIHSFSFKFLFSYIEQKNESYEEIKSSCIKYIDDLYNSNQLELPNPNHFNIDSIGDNAHGYGYWIKNDYEIHINDIKDHIKKRMNESLENRYQDYNNEVMSALSNDIKKFTELLTVTSDNVGRFSNIDILSKINPSKFVDTWLSTPRSNWFAVKNTLYSRYNSGRLSANLSDEVDFIIKIKENLQQRANNEIGIKKLRIERLIPTIEVPESHTDGN